MGIHSSLFHPSAMIKKLFCSKMTTESVTLEAAEKLIEESKRPGANVIKLFLHSKVTTFC